jgi:hypothetical protein
VCRDPQERDTRGENKWIGDSCNPKYEILGKSWKILPISTYNRRCTIPSLFVTAYLFFVVINEFFRFSHGVMNANTKRCKERENKRESAATRLFGHNLTMGK